MQKSVPFKFDEECIAAFKQLKKALIEAPIIKPPKWDQPFEIICEIDSNAVSAIVAQHEGNELNVIHYASHTLNDAQGNYEINDSELYAVILACEKFRSYITDAKVRIHTDCQAVKTVLDKKDSKPRLIRWALLLQEFDMQILDRDVIKNTKLDILLMEPNIVERPGKELCTPYGTKVSLDGTTKLTFGNTGPPVTHLFIASSKPEGQKVCDFDENDYPNDLCPSKFARIGFLLNC